MPRLRTYKDLNVRKLIKPHSAILCLECGWVGISWHRHDYKTCQCSNVAMIDGGFDYMRCGAKDLKLVQYLNIVPMVEAE